MQSPHFAYVPFDLPSPPQSQRFDAPNLDPSLRFRWQNAFLEASLNLIQTSGLEALTLRAVAKKLGVSHAAQLYHFPKRATLLGALAEQGFERFATTLEAALSTSLSLPNDDLLLRVGRAYLIFARENPQHLKYVIER